MMLAKKAPRYTLQEVGTRLPILLLKDTKTGESVNVGLSDPDRNSVLRRIVDAANRDEPGPGHATMGD